MMIARFARSAALALALCSPAHAQTYRDTAGTAVPGSAPLVGCSSSGTCAGPVSAVNPMPVTGSFSASFSGFTPTPAYATLSVGATSSRVALPSGTVVIVYNTGSNAAFVQLGGPGVSATSGNDVIQPGSWLAFTVGMSTYLAAIETAGTTTLNLSGGAGLPAGAGGGGGSGGSVPTGSAGSPNASVVSVQGVSGGAGVPVTGTFWQSTQPVSLASLPALATGANTIGAVTQSGTWTVQPGNTANTTAWLVTGAGGTFPSTQSGTWNIANISGAVSLPTGAATAANQTNVQASPGSSASSALGVQGVTGGLAVTVTPKTASLTVAGCTVGTSSAQCLAGSTATNHVQIQNAAASGGANIACSWGGTAILNASGSIQLQPGQSALWGPTTSGVPSAALNCIAGSASTPLYLEYN